MTVRGKKICIRVGVGIIIVGLMGVFLWATAPTYKEARSAAIKKVEWQKYEKEYAQANYDSQSIAKRYLEEPASVKKSDKEMLGRGTGLGEALSRLRQYGMTRGKNGENVLRMLHAMKQTGRLYSADSYSARWAAVAAEIQRNPHRRLGTSGPLIASTCFVGVGVFLLFIGWVEKDEDVVDWKPKKKLVNPQK